MRKRDRSSSLSPIASATSGADISDQHIRLRQQVLFDILRRTSLAEQKDREIVEWLTDAAEWLQNDEFEKFGAGSLTELRFLLLGVLHTMPWWRVVESVDPKRVNIASRSGRCASRAVTRWHEKIQLAFERVCVLLIEQSPHAVRGVLEVIMKPFHVRSPVADGARRLVPADSIMRIINAVATKYPSSVVLDVLEQCMRLLVPKRRWAEQRHHTTCIALFLHLALEAYVPLFPTRNCDHDIYLTQSVTDMLLNTTQSITNRGSEDSGTDAGVSSTSHKYHSLHPLVMSVPVMSASDADFSDASSINVTSNPTVQSSATRFTEFTMQNNRMLAYRNELIRFILRQLLDMELSLQSSESEPQQELISSCSSFSFGSPADSNRVLIDLPSGRIKERPADKPFIDILRVCTTLVFHKLAEDLVRQQAAGVCGNAEWWREILSFHLSFVTKMESSIYLLYLAPSLALLGGEEEAIDIMHKLVSLVTKGYQPVQQNTWRTAATGPARVRMAPPTVGPLMIPMVHRVRAALYLYPLFHFLRDRIGNGEGTRKRLQKWLAQELKKTASSSCSSSFSTSSPSQLVLVLFAQCAAMSHLLGADFVEEMNVYAPGSPTLQSLWDKYLLPVDTERRSDGGENANRSDDMSISSTTPNDNIDGVVCSSSVETNGVCRRQLDLAKMEASGLLRMTLMNDCPWDWRRFQR